MSPYRHAQAPSEGTGENRLDYQMSTDMTTAGTYW